MTRRAISLSFSVGAILLAAQVIFDLPGALAVGIAVAGVGMIVHPLWSMWRSRRSNHSPAASE